MQMHITGIVMVYSADLHKGLKVETQNIGI